MLPSFVQCGVVFDLLCGACVGVLCVRLSIDVACVACCVGVVCCCAFCLWLYFVVCVLCVMCCCVLCAVGFVSLCCGSFVLCVACWRECSVCGFGLCVAVSLLFLFELSLCVLLRLGLFLLCWFGLVLRCLCVELMCLCCLCCLLCGVMCCVFYVRLFCATPFGL